MALDGQTLQQAMQPNSLSRDTADRYARIFTPVMLDGGLDVREECACFFAQLGHESLGLTVREEFASGSAYEGRSDLGNTQRGDGVRFKGRGFIQITGRYNYRRAGQAIHEDLEGNPERAEQPEIAAKVAVWYWNSRNLSSYARGGVTAGEFRAVTRAINGGYYGLADRLARWRRIRALGDAIIPAQPVTLTDHQELLLKRLDNHVRRLIGLKHDKIHAIAEHYSEQARIKAALDSQLQRSREEAGKAPEGSDRRQFLRARADRIDHKVTAIRTPLREHEARIREAVRKHEESKNG